MTSRWIPVAASLVLLGCGDNVRGDGDGGETGQRGEVLQLPVLAPGDGARRLAGPGRQQRTEFGD